MLAMLQLELKRNLQDKGLLFWMVILPIIITVLFISVFTSGITGEEKETVMTTIVAGYVVMFIFFIIISIVSSFLKDRDLGMTARIASTPLSPKSYLIGKWLPFVMIVWVQIFILLLFGKLVYRIPLEQPVYILLLSIILAFTSTAIGLMIALLIQTENMGIAITQIIALGGAVLGGLWMPLEFMPDFVQKIAKVLPQYWGHQGIVGAMQGELDFRNFVLVFVVILGYGLLAFMLSLLIYPSFLRKAKG